METASRLLRNLVNSWSENMADHDKIISALAGIEPYDPQEDDSTSTFQNVSTGNYIPPAYIVAFIFLSVLEYKNHGERDKVWWHTYFQYKDLRFLVRDYKFGSWSLESRGDIVAAQSLVPEIIGKIHRASRYADRLLKKEFKRQIYRGQFYINNGYLKLRNAYEFYLDEAKVALGKLTDLESTAALQKPTVHAPIEYLNQHLHLENVLAYRSAPVMTSFFSLLEFLLDAFFAFEQPSMTFIRFRSLPWRERFKKVIQVTLDSPFTSAYEKLGSIKSRYRDPLTHGLTSETSLLVPFSFAGLVPVSYEHLSNSLHFGFAAVTREAVEEMFRVFEDFFESLSEHEPYCYYVQYIEYNFPIPAEKHKTLSIRKEMTSYEGFEEFLQAKSMYDDAVINRDI